MAPRLRQSGKSSGAARVKSEIAPAQMHTDQVRVLVAQHQLPP
jgi:hypothetical protein